MLVPIYGFLEGDTIGLVVLVHDYDRVGDIVERIQQAASVRVAPRRGMVAMRGGKALQADLTIAQAGLAPLDRVDVVEARP
jgi:hypothetical protein